MTNSWVEMVCLGNPIVEYIRDRRNNKIGVLFSGIGFTTEGETVVVGWSLCSKYDTFDKFKGVNIASGRALANDRLSQNILNNAVKLDDIMPVMVQYAMTDFVARVKRYYKTTEFSKFAEMFDI